MRILINATGSHGDVLPFIALAREFQQRGHDARLYATAVFEPFAREAGLSFKALGSVEDYESLLRDPDISSHLARQLRVVARGMDDFGHAAFQAMDADILTEDTVIVGSTLARANILQPILCRSPCSKGWSREWPISRSHCGKVQCYLRPILSPPQPLSLSWATG